MNLCSLCYLPRNRDHRHTGVHPIDAAWKLGPRDPPATRLHDAVPEARPRAAPRGVLAAAATLDQRPLAAHYERRRVVGRLRDPILLLLLLGARQRRRRPSSRRPARDHRRAQRGSAARTPPTSAIVELARRFRRSHEGEERARFRGCGIGLACLRAVGKGLPAAGDPLPTSRAPVWGGVTCPGASGASAGRGGRSHLGPPGRRGRK